MGFTQKFATAGAVGERCRENRHTSPCVAAYNVARACRPRGFSARVQLEEVIGEPLFDRKGRQLTLTHAGRVALRYSDEIFSLGGELVGVLKGRESGAKPLRLVVGVSHVLPKSIVYKLLQPALDLKVPVQLVVREDRAVQDLIGDLASHAVDVLLSDGPLGPGPVRAFSHLLGDCATTFFATPALASKLREGFPGSLQGAPLLAPGIGSALRGSLERWMSDLGIRPVVAAEIDDSALAKVFAEMGRGVVMGPSVIEAEIRNRYHLEIVGRAENLRQQYYAISVERRLKHPAVVAISTAARAELFEARQPR